MPNSVINLHNVSKTFTYAKRQGLKGFLKPERKQIKAVDNVTLQVEAGETVAFIGPNGAGKSTTIKMLCGILQPSKGLVRVLELNPLNQRRQLAYRIGTVFGQRSQLIFNLPLIDSLKLTADMYAIPRGEVKRRIDEVTAQFNLSEFADQPVRKLSLGQRMRAEVANLLLYNPEIVFLDEPTIGLDVVARRSLREAVRAINREQGTTIFLTSHDVGDIEEVCDRTIIINHGRIMLDTPTDRLGSDYLTHKTVRVVLKKSIKEVPSILGVVPTLDADGVATYSVDTSRRSMKTFLTAMLEALEVADMTVQDTPLEDIIHELYTRQAP